MIKIDKDFCMSSFLAFRYIEKDDVDFFKGVKHQKLPAKNNKRIAVSSAEEIDENLKKIFKKYKNEKLGIMLSGGMDSAILASYMPGCDAYTFRYLNGKFGAEEMHRAEQFAKKYNLKLHYVDIDWNVVDKYLDKLMLAKGAPIHSIEPQIYAAALQAKNDGITKIITGEGSDSVFGGLNKLLSKDWEFDDFVKFYTFTDPDLVLKHPVDVSYLYDRYRQGNKIDFLNFVLDIHGDECAGTYYNPFTLAELPYDSPYDVFALSVPLDLKRIRAGESKYLIRELFKIKYPEFPVPEKIPMQRPVDEYFKNWAGPKRPEFKENLDMNKFTGNQKWQLYCLERFLNLLDKKHG